MIDLVKGLMGIWAGLGGIIIISGLTGASGADSGLLANSVCISPIVFLFAAATPPGTLVRIVEERLGLIDSNT